MTRQPFYPKTTRWDGLHLRRRWDSTLCPLATCPLDCVAAGQSSPRPYKSHTMAFITGLRIPSSAIQKNYQPFRLVFSWQQLIKIIRFQKVSNGFTQK